MFTSYVALGDSFTEGVGDDLGGGNVRGWADFVALGLAHEAADAGLQGGVTYANLAIRGRKLGPIIEEQLAPAIALAPQLLSINGGGNDIMRPKVSVQAVAEQLLDAVRTTADAGIQFSCSVVETPVRICLLGHSFAAEVMNWLRPCAPTSRSQE